MVFIKELLANPVGPDTDGEWIKIINTGDEAINISGWSLTDASGKTFSFQKGTSIPQATEITLRYSQTKIPLNNDGDTLKLKDSTGSTVDTLSYSGQVSDDEIIIADRFIEITESASPDPQSLKDLALVGQGPLITNVSSTPLFVALTIALVSGLTIGFLQKRMHEE